MRLTPPFLLRPVQNGVIWLKRLKRKSSRRWNKKWEKRGLKIDTNRMRAKIDKALKGYQEKIYQELLTGIYSNAD